MARRDDLQPVYLGKMVALDTPSALAASLEAQQIPAITRWNRLEGRPRSVDFDQAMRAEVRDAMWSLSKQWQVGEFAGEDAGSPAGASIHIEQARFTQFAAGNHALAPLTDEEPIELRIERQPIVWSFGANPLAFDLRLALGRRWRKLLVRAGLSAPIPGFLEAYAIAMPDPDDPAQADVVAHPMVAQRISAVAGRMIDGGALYLFLRAAPANRASAGIAGLSAADAAAIDALGDDFVAWVASLISEPGDGEDGWRPERLEYSARLTTEPEGGPARRDDELLVADEIQDGRVDWYHFDRAARAGGLPPAPAATPVAFLPAPLEYGGMPNPRWWQFEEGATNFGAIDPGSSDVGKLLFLEHVLLYANDWFIFPHRVVAGSNALVRGLAVTNVFGERFWIGAAGARDSESWQGWGLFANNLAGDPDDRSDRHITVLPTAAKVQDAELAETQMLIRDEMANQAWAIEQRVRTASGQVLRGAELAMDTRNYFQAQLGSEGGTAPQPTDAALKYQLMTRVPENWIPFVPVHKEGDSRQTKLQRAAMPRLLDGDHRAPQRIRPRTALIRAGLEESPRRPMFVENEEVPRAGIQLTDGFRRTRWYDGRTYLWRGLRKHVGRGEGSSGLAFDQLLPKPVEPPASALPSPAGRHAPIEVTADPPPALTLTAHPDPAGGWNLEIGTSHLTLAPEHDGSPHVEGEGHLALLVNGIAVSRLYGPWHYLAPLLQGTHEIIVLAAANDGRPLSLRGEPIAAVALVEQAEVGNSHGHGPGEEVDPAAAPVLALAASVSPAGGYILHAMLEGLTLAPARAGGPHVAGEGHFLLYVDDHEEGRVYGPWFFLSPLAIGAHHVAIAAVTNDHRPYLRGGEPVMAEVEIVVSENGMVAIPDPDHEHVPPGPEEPDHPH